jgi:hypothetical protein
MRVPPVVRALTFVSVLAVLTAGPAAQSTSSPSWLAPYRENAPPMTSPGSGSPS